MDGTFISNFKSKTGGFVRSFKFFFSSLTGEVGGFEIYLHSTTGVTGLLKSCTFVASSFSIFFFISLTMFAVTFPTSLVCVSISLRCLVSSASVCVCVETNIFSFLTSAASPWSVYFGSTLSKSNSFIKFFLISSFSSSEMKLRKVRSVIYPFLIYRWYFYNLIKLKKEWCSSA